MADIEISPIENWYDHWRAKYEQVFNDRSIDSDDYLGLDISNSLVFANSD